MRANERVTGERERESRANRAQRREDRDIRQKKTQMGKEQSIKNIEEILDEKKRERERKGERAREKKKMHK
jgi:hypothetical protein